MNLTPVLVVGIIVWGIYSLFELFVKRRERLAIIDKIEKLNSTEFGEGIKIPLVISNNSSRFTSLKIALLMIGIGLGCCIAFFLHGSILSDFRSDDYHLRENFYEIKSMIYFSCIALFGGIGLLVSYFIESYQKNKQ